MHFEDDAWYVPQSLNITAFTALRTPSKRKSREPCMLQTKVSRYLDRFRLLYCEGQSRWPRREESCFELREAGSINIYSTGSVWRLWETDSGTNCVANCAVMDVRVCNPNRSRVRRHNGNRCSHRM